MAVSGGPSGASVNGVGAAPLTAARGAARWAARFSAWSAEASSNAASDRSTQT